MSTAPLHWIATPSPPADAGVLWLWLPLPGAGHGRWCFTLLSLPPAHLDERDRIGAQWAQAVREIGTSAPSARQLQALGEQHLTPLHVEFLGLVVEPDTVHTFRSAQGAIYRMHQQRLLEVAREPGARTWPADTEAWLLMTSQACQALPEDAVRDGLLSLTPKDCSETLLTLVDQRGASAAGAGLWTVRKALPHPSLRTSPRRFLAARSGVSEGTLHLGDDSIALKAGDPPTANFPLPDHLPKAAAAPAPAKAAAPAKAGGTLLLSPDQLDALRSAVPSGAPASRPAPGAPAASADAFTEETTALLSADAHGGKAPPSSSATSPGPSKPAPPAGPRDEAPPSTQQGTALLSADQLQQAYQQAGIDPPPPRATPAAASGKDASRAPAAASTSNDFSEAEPGTALLSADQLQQAFRQAGVEPPPTRAKRDPQAEAAPQAKAASQVREGTALLSAEAIDAAVEASRRGAAPPSAAPGVKSNAPAPTAQRDATAFLDADAIRNAMATTPAARASAPAPAAARESTAYMDSAALEQAIRHAAEEPAPPSRSRGPLLLAAALGLGVLIAGAAWFLLPREAATPTVPPSEPPGQEEPAAAATPPPPFVEAEEATAPDGHHEADGMPYALLNLTVNGEEVRLQVDAHEVLAGQMTRMRRAISDMELVYRNTSQALYQYMPCDEIHLEGAAGTARTPACATPESAEAYCNAVGRRLLTTQEWTAILRAERARLAPGHGRHWSGIDDGPMPERPEEVRGIVGVLDGYAEVLRADRETLASGALPVLRAQNGQAQVHVAAGLWDRVRTRQGTLQEITRLSFRCGMDAPAEDVASEEESPAVAAAEQPSPGSPSAAPRAQRPAAPATRPATSDRTARQPAAPSPTPDPAPQGAPSLREDRAPARTQAAAQPAQVDDDGRLQLMDPVYLPRSMQDFEEQLDEPR